MLILNSEKSISDTLSVLLFHAPASALKVLLDENLPHNLRHSLVGHHVMSVDYTGWSGEKNGELLTLCEAEGFDVLLTGDQNLSFSKLLRTAESPWSFWTHSI